MEYDKQHDKVDKEIKKLEGEQIKLKENLKNSKERLVRIWIIISRVNNCYMFV